MWAAATEQRQNSDRTATPATQAATLTCRLGGAVTLAAALEAALPLRLMALVPPLLLLLARRLRLLGAPLVAAAFRQGCGSSRWEQQVGAAGGSSR